MKKSKPKRTRVRSPAKPGASMVQRTIQLTQSTTSPLHRRVSLALTLLKVDPIQAGPILMKLAEHPTISEKMATRINRALLRYESRLSRSSRRVRDIAVSKPPDLRGPATMQILLDEDLLAQWNALHGGDASEIYERYKNEVLARSRIPIHLIDELKRAYSDFAERTKALDELARQHPRKPVSDDLPPTPAEYYE